jgi:hypothetical protein
MPKIYDVVKAMGNYTTADGQEKTRWLNCGMIIQNPDSGKVSLKLDCLPVGLPTDDGMWFALMTPQPRGGQRPPAQNPQQPQGFRDQGQQQPPAQSGQGGAWGDQANNAPADEDIPF